MLQLLLQDTFLLATQQEVTLTAELAAARAAAEAEAAGHGGGAEGTPLPVGTQGLIRRRLFCHRSPTDNLLVAMGRWMDNAIPLVPNRYQAALAAGPTGESLIRSVYAKLLPGSISNKYLRLGKAHHFTETQPFMPFGGTRMRQLSGCQPGFG